MNLSLTPASSHPIPFLADLMTRSFEGYLVPINITEPIMHTMKRRQAVFGFGFAAIVTAFVAWRLALRAAELGRLGDLSSHLGFPLAWLAWFLAAASAVTVVVFAGLA